MKIDFIISSLGGGGAERVAAIMLNSLSQNRENDVSVVTLFEREKKYKLNTSVNVVKLQQIKYIPSHTIRSIISLCRYYKNKSNRPDVIVSFITLTNLITIIVAKIFRIKIIAQEHNSHLRYMKGRKLSTDITKKYLYKKADVLTVLTAFDVAFYKNYGANVYVMPNPSSFQSITDNSHKREKVILAVGDLNKYHHKGFDNLINLMVPIFEKHPDWKLKIAGSGDKGLKYLSEIAQKTNTSNKITFTGFVDNISDLMYRSSIFILSSRFEGLPMVLLEAMSQGMACIAYDCKTGPSDIIENYKNGILVKDQNKQEMINELLELIDNPDLRKRLSSEAIKSLDKYHINTITDRYESLFEKVVGK
jgi:glycosyltransferase involved in cell wall biosynthesis